MQSAYADSDFREMLFNTALMKEGDDFLELFPELRLYEEFQVKSIKGLLNKNTMFKYVALVYDKNSPYTRSFSSQTRRKKEVARDLNLIDKTIPHNVLQVFLGNNLQVNQMIIGYGIIQYDTDWATLCTYHDKIYQSLFLLRNSTDIDKDLNAAISLWNKEVDIIKKKMLSEDTADQLNIELLKRVVGTNLGITPEEQAAINKEK